jgi:hypothetical protein
MVLGFGLKALSSSYAIMEFMSPVPRAFSRLRIEFNQMHQRKGFPGHPAINGMVKEDLLKLS